MFATAAHLQELADELAGHLRLLDPASSVRVGSIEPFGDGHSGYTYAVELEWGDRHGPLVLRLSPPGVRIAGPADVGRQGRVMAALSAAGLPVPHVFAHDSAPAIAGRSFALMELVEGEPWEAAAAAGSHRLVAERAAATLRRIHAVPEHATGLAGERPVSPLGELRRWSSLLARAPRPLRDRAAALAVRLRATAPSPSPPALVHGDYHYGNLVFAGGDVAAVLDWEITQLGEPLLDVGCLIVASMRRRYEPEPNPTGSVDVTPAELLDMYGADPDEAAWFVGLSCFKYAAILGYNYQLHRSGRRPDPVYEQLQNTTHGLLDDGLGILAERSMA